MTARPWLVGGVAVDVGASPGTAGTVSEDQVCRSPSAMILLDGVSTVIPGVPPGGGWYAARLGQGLAAELGSSPGADLQEVLAGRIRLLATAYGLRPGAGPASTVAIVRWHAGRVDVLLLGDSTIVVEHVDGNATVVDDPRLAAAMAAAPVPDYRQRLRAGGGFDERHRSLLAERRAWQIDHLMNRPGGYWIAEVDPSAAYEAHVASWRAADVAAVAAMTDGVAPAVTDYGLFPTWQDLFRAAAVDGAQALVDGIRAAELRDDPTGRRWPRPKPADDKALAIARLNPHQQPPAAATGPTP